MVKFRYSPEMIDWLRTHSRGVEYGKLATDFNRCFRLSKTARQIQSACHDHGAHNGIYKSTGTNHKTPRRYRPVGATRVNKDGYIFIKIADPCKWELAHIVEWEKYNGHLDRRKYILLFLDGDRTNWHIDNLYRMERKYIGVLNALGLSRHINKDTIESIILVVQAHVEQWAAMKKLHGGDRGAISANRKAKYHQMKSDPVRWAEHQAKVKEYNTRPDVVAHRRAYFQSRWTEPDYRERHREYCRRYVAKKRAKKGITA